MLYIYDPVQAVLTLSTHMMVRIWSEGEESLWLPLRILRWSTSIHDVMLNGPDEQKGELGKWYTLRWKVNPTKIQEPSIAVKLLEHQWPGVHQEISFKIEDKVLYLTHLTMKKETWVLGGLLEIWRPGKTALAHIPSDLK